MPCISRQVSQWFVLNGFTWLMVMCDWIPELLRLVQCSISCGSDLQFFIFSKFQFSNKYKEVLQFSDKYEDIIQVFHHMLLCYWVVFFISLYCHCYHHVNNENFQPALSSFKTAIYRNGSFLMISSWVLFWDVYLSSLHHVM